MSSPRLPPQAHQRRNTSNMRGTLIGFFTVLGLALPTFIYFKQRNDTKARELYAQKRVKTGALSQMGGGEKVQ
ncbi:hypothetical protein JCM10207_004380 [Rhodosporidiobolus poonsookiae]